MSWFGNNNQNNEAELMKKISDVLTNVQNGKLSNRVILYNNNTKLEKIAWNLNNSLDQMEVILRESRNTIEAVRVARYSLALSVSILVL